MLFLQSLSYLAISISLSHNLPYLPDKVFKLNYISNHPRYRRSLDYNDVFPSIYIDAFDRVFEILLNPHNEELALNLDIIIAHGHDIHTTLDGATYLNMLYTGTVKGDKHSHVEGNIIDGIFAGRITISSLESLPISTKKCYNENFQNTQSKFFLDNHDNISDVIRNNDLDFSSQSLTKISNSEPSAGYDAFSPKKQPVDPSISRHNPIKTHPQPTVFFVERINNYPELNAKLVNNTNNEPYNLTSTYHSIMYIAEHTKDYDLRRKFQNREKFSTNSYKIRTKNKTLNGELKNILKLNQTQSTNMANINVAFKTTTKMGSSNFHPRFANQMHYDLDDEEADSWCGLSHKRIRDWMMSHYTSESLLRPTAMSPQVKRSHKSNESLKTRDKFSLYKNEEMNINKSVIYNNYNISSETIKQDNSQIFLNTGHQHLRKSAHKKRIARSALDWATILKYQKRENENKDKNGNLYKSYYFKAQQQKQNTNNNNNKGTSKIPEKNTCSLFIQTDTFLWNHLAKKHNTRDKERIRKEIITMISAHIKAINHIYGSTDFGEYKGIQFMVSRVKILEDTYCDNIVDQKQRQYCNPNLDVSNLLNLWSLENHDDFCLAYLWTYRDFTGGTLGLAWVAAPERRESGGICEHYKNYNNAEEASSPISGLGLHINGRRVENNKSLNTGIMTFVNYAAAVSPRVTHLTFAHEIGHNLGSPHDYPTECRPGQALGDRNGNYLMFSSATSGDKPNNDKFSGCSKHNISQTLASVITERNGKANCLIKSGGAFCGNGIKEEGEECDCGYPEDCQKSGEIQCCYPRTDDAAKSCKRREGVVCSPSEGPCCTKQCKALSSTTLCASSTECSYQSFCNGLAAECPSPRHKPNRTTACNDNTQVCWNGECSGSICEKFNMEQCFMSTNNNNHNYNNINNGGITKKPVNGYKQNDRGKLCQLACQLINQPETCKSSYEYPVLRAINQGRGINLKPGSPCNNYQGYCDIFLKCREIHTGPLKRLKNLIFNTQTFVVLKDWIVQHWWAISLITLGIVVFMAMFIKFCAVHTPSSNPKKPPARSFSDTMSRTANTIRRTSHHVLHSANTLRRISSHPQHAASTEMPIGRIRVIGAENNLRGVKGRSNNPHGNIRSKNKNPRAGNNNTNNANIVPGTTSYNYQNGGTPGVHIISHNANNSNKHLARSSGPTSALKMKMMKRNDAALYIGTGSGNAITPQHMMRNKTPFKATNNAKKRSASKSEPIKKQGKAQIAAMRERRNQSEPPMISGGLISANGKGLGRSAKSKKGSLPTNAISHESTTNIPYQIQPPSQHYIKNEAKRGGFFSSSSSPKPKQAQMTKSKLPNEKSNTQQQPKTKSKIKIKNVKERNLITNTTPNTNNHNVQNGNSNYHNANSNININNNDNHMSNNKCPVPPPLDTLPLGPPPPYDNVVRGGSAFTPIPNTISSNDNNNNDNRPSAPPLGAMERVADTIPAPSAFLLPHVTKLPKGGYGKNYGIYNQNQSNKNNPSAAKKKRLKK